MTFVVFSLRQLRCFNEMLSFGPKSLIKNLKAALADRSVSYHSHTFEMVILI